MRPLSQRRQAMRESTITPDFFRAISSDVSAFAVFAIMFAALIQDLSCAAFFTEGLPAFAFLASRHISFRIGN
jgi:Na+/phosphate symporter